MTKPKVLSLCTGLGLMDKAFIDAGFEVIPGCEIDNDMAAMYAELCGRRPIFGDIKELIGYARLLRDMGYNFLKVDGIIGGPPCQAKSRLKGIREPKFPDLTPLVEEVLQLIPHKWLLFENVAPLEFRRFNFINRVKLNAMNFAQPHQHRMRWFTHSENVPVPEEKFPGSAEELMAYPAVAGRIYGVKRCAILQGMGTDDFRRLLAKFGADKLRKGLVNAVPYELASAWAEQILDAYEFHWTGARYWPDVKN